MVVFHSPSPWSLSSIHLATAWIQHRPLAVDFEDRWCIQHAQSFSNIGFSLGFPDYRPADTRSILKKTGPFPFQRLNSQRRDGVKSSLSFALEEALPPKAIIGSREGTLVDLMSCLQRCSWTFFSEALPMFGAIAALKMLPNNTVWFRQALFVMMDPACFSSKG